jgi:uncharacterized NAD(P)/FAD-binding protein YdhS
MSVLNFVANNWDSILLLGGALGGWLGITKKKTSEDELWERALDFARAQFPEILTYADAHHRARTMLEAAVWKGLNRIGVKKTRRLDLLVDEVVDKALAELATKLIEHNLARIGKAMARADEKLATAL